MRAFLALIRREFIEHRGAFFLAPVALFVILVLVTLLTLNSGGFERMIAALVGAVPMRIFEVGFLALGVGWWLYLAGAAFFYCADAFSADKRNNAMLFWKSMPQSDHAMLGAKFAAATLLLPLIVFLALLASGAVGLGVVMGLGRLAPGEGALAYLEIAGALAVALGASILWYAPALAWVGLLATLAGRWSVPLALLTPALVALVETILAGPGQGGHVWAYLSSRLAFPVSESPDLEEWVFGFRPFSAGVFVPEFLARIDWLQIGVGLAFAALALALAGEVRRRSLAG